MSETALDRVRRYIWARREKPLRQADDQIHGVHVGTEWEATLRLSDLEEVARLATRTPTELERELVEDAAELLHHYAEFIRTDVKADDFERHPYVPEIERVAEALAALSRAQPKQGGLF